jgi:hypothetical protein
MSLFLLVVAFLVMALISLAVENFTFVYDAVLLGLCLAVLSRPRG